MTGSTKFCFSRFMTGN
ncbi:peptide IlvX [Enterobacter roggenkampii]|nr:peptide IlvX [Enterobacter roggenkampii]MCE5967163.1 peptide IlvX [Enterobacter roggenkampii]MCE5971595.1 peptide IlvX [Enterobacter roggenkampii]UHY24878.1 peptide IlvX [Enterobacter roggenkampii]